VGGRKFVGLVGGVFSNQSVKVALAFTLGELFSFENHPFREV